MNKTVTYVKKVFADKYSIVLLGILIIIAFSVAFQHYFYIEVNSRIKNPLLWHIPFNLFYWLYWFPVFPLLRRQAKHKPFGDSFVSNWLFFYILLPVIITVIHQLLAAITIASILPGYDFQITLYKRLVRNKWIWVDIVFYFALGIIVQILEYHEKNRVNELRFVQLEGQLAESKLRTLKSQLHPHFLFNTLNTLSTLILEPNNHEAERMLILLDRFLRKTIYESEQPVIPLREELEFIKNYLDIEKVRFADSLHVDEAISPDVLDAIVPNFLLQPLVENSIHHAISARGTNGLIMISASKSNGQLSISVEDNGPEFAGHEKKSNRSGVGLKITRQRLLHLYGTKQSLALEASRLGGLKVTINLPFILN